MRQGLHILDFLEDQITQHKEDFDPNCPKDFVDLCLQKAELEGDDTSSLGAGHIKNIILDLFLAGTDTTAASLSWFLLYLIRYPEVQAKCHEEIDSVLEAVGPLPQSSWNKSFPYTNAALLETQRIASIASGSVFHVVRENTVVGGYHLKKGSAVTANIRFSHQHEGYWGGPQVFRPERWLDPTDASKIVNHSHFIPFSIGKRRCLGQNLAKLENAMFGITLLQNFNFKMEDPSNPPALEGGGLVFSPIPYKMVIEARA